MKNKLAKMLTLIAIVAFAIVRSTNCEIAYADENNHSIGIGRDYAEIYLQTIFDSAVSSVIKDNESLYGKYEVSDFKYTDPYIVYRFGEIQDEIYYYPVYNVKNHKIYYNIAIIGTENGYTFSISDDIANELNDFNYLDCECIVYYFNNVLTIQNEFKKKEFEIKENIELKIDNFVYDRFNDANFIEKCEIIRKFEKSGLKKHTRSNFSEEEIINKRIGSNITLQNPQGQYSYNICWASSAATVVNTLTSVTTSGIQICNLLHKDYYSGGYCIDIQDALRLYNINYNKIRYIKMAWEKVKSNINAGKPIIINVYPGIGMGHSLTVYGYATDNGYIVRFWDSNKYNGTGGYSYMNYDEGIYTSASGTSYDWLSSVSYK